MHWLAAITFLYLIAISYGTSISYWKGGSGIFHDASMWSSGLPSEYSAAIINIGLTEAIYLKQNITLSSLTLISGVIYQSPNTTITILNQFNITSGLISVSTSESLLFTANIMVYGQSIINGESSFTLKSIYFNQINGTVYWKNGDIILSNSTINIHNNATISIQNDASSILKIITDQSRTCFDEYPYSVLNTAINLEFSLPVAASAYDLIVNDAVRAVVATDSNVHLYRLAAYDSYRATKFYSSSVTGLDLGYKQSMYNQTESDVSVNECATLCIQAKSWCKSFDYKVLNQSCYLSAFKKSQVGGLTAISSIKNNISFPISHYELRSYEREMDSFLIIDGLILIESNQIETTTKLLIDVTTTMSNQAYISTPSNITVLQTLEMLDNFVGKFYSKTLLMLINNNSSLRLSSEAEITNGNSISSSQNTTQISFLSGSHYLKGKITGNISVNLDNNAVLSIVSRSNIANNSVMFSELSLRGSSQVDFAGNRSWSILSSIISLSESSKIYANISSFIWSDSVIISNSSSISASGKGFSKMTGPGAGERYFSGASGASHGGRGGPGKVDAKSSPYGSVYFPSSAGSGGGVGFYNDSSGGNGGGIIHLYSRYVRVDGLLESNGQDGLAGGGGGAGGSILIEVTESLEGSGVISAAGGDGGYSGGLIAGGGGSGGRIALISNKNITFDGHWDITGGYLHPTYDLSNAEQAGPGTIFVYIGGNETQAIVTSNSVLRNYINKVSFPSSCNYSNFSSVKSSLKFRGSYLFESDSDFLNQNCNIDLHVVGSAPLIIAGNRFCLSRTFGSGSNPAVIADFGANLNFSSSNYTLQSITLELKNCTYPTQSELTVSNYGILYLSNSATDLYDFYRLTINAFGSIKSSYGVSITSKTINFNSYSSLLSNGTLSLRSNNISFEDSKLIGSSFSLTIGGESVTRDVTDIIFHADSSVSMQGDITLSNVKLINYGFVYFENSLRVLGVSKNEIFQTNSTVQGVLLKANANATIEVTFNVYGILTFNNNAFLRILRGGQCNSSCSLLLESNNNSLWVENNLFKIGNSAVLRGSSGSIAILNNGSITMPNYISSIAPMIIVSHSGSVVLDDEKYEFHSTFSIEKYGSVTLLNSTVLEASHFLLNEGTLQLLSSSSVELCQNTSWLISGTIKGNGSMIIQDTASVFGGANTYNNELKILQTNIYNFGSVSFLNGNVQWAQSSKLFNYGNLTFNGSQVWLFNESIYAYQDTGLCTFDSLPYGGVTYYNTTTIEQCADYCTDNSVFHTKSVAIQQLEEEYLTCQSFLYNYKLQLCQVHINPINELTGCIVPFDDETNEFNWRSMLKIDSWTKSPTFINQLQGNIRFSSNSTCEIHIPLINSGSIITEESSSVYLLGYVDHNSFGKLTVNGNLYLTPGNDDNQFSGQIDGFGIIQFDSSSSNKGSLTYLNTALSIPYISMIIKGNVVAWSDMNLLHVLDLTLSGGLFKLNVPVTLLVENYTHIENGGKIFSTTTAITNDLDCTTCYDLNLTSTIIVLSSNGTIDVSFGYITALENITIISSSSISCTGRGYSSSNYGSRLSWTGKYSLLGSSGGNHAGFGGIGYTKSSISQFDLYSTTAGYGSFYFPNSWGAAGGNPNNFNSTDSSGGGILVIKAKELLLNGNIECNGQSPSDSIAGGGSGGSIRVYADVITGSGLLSVSGGNGGVKATSTVGYGGGGGGGRILIISANMNDFIGNISATGGFGFQKGSGGTIYLRNPDCDYGCGITSGGHLIIKNIFDGETSSVSNSELYTILNEPLPYGPLDTISMLNGAKLSVKVDISVRNIVGDVDGLTKVFFSNASILSTLGNSTSVTTNTLVVENTQLYLSQHTVNSSIIHIKNGGKLNLLSTNLRATDGYCRYNFDKIIIEDGGELIINYHSDYNQMMNSSIVVINITNFLYIASGGKLTSNGQGYSGQSSTKICSDSNANNLYYSGPGCGADGAMGAGGAGYGGDGGSGVSGSGGNNYGDLSAPLLFGSSGGKCFNCESGGIGGGVIYLHTNSIQLEGVISANGLCGSEGGAGGGSGGSVHVVTAAMSGSGKIEACGGDGLLTDVYFGGAGGGGRIKIICSNCTLAYDTNGQKILSHNISFDAKGGFYSSDTTSEHPSSVWIDKGKTLLNWLQLSPLKASGGTIYLINGENTTKTTSLSITNEQPSSITIDFSLVNGSTITKNNMSFSLKNAYTNINNTVYEYDYLILQNRAYAKIVAGASVMIHQIIADNKTSLLVSDGSTLLLPSETTLSYLSLTVIGAVSGGNYLNISSSIIKIYPNSTWGSSQLTSSNSSLSNTYSFLSDRVYSAINITKLSIGNNSTLVFVGGDLYQDQRSVLICDYLTLEVGSFITASRYGYASANIGASTQSKNQTSHPFRKASGNISYGDGGWHSGRGGGVYYSYKAYGSAFTPIEYGAAGGSTFSRKGGSGGGAIRIISNTYALINGDIVADGASCTDESEIAGAGAGGSVWIEVINGNLEGTGLISASGGSGCVSSSQGGAGSGGRVAVFEESGKLSQFNGSIVVRAGVQYSPINAYQRYPILSPAGGTIYVADNSGLYGYIVGTNHGNGGAEIYAANICNTETNASIYFLNSIFMSDSNVTFDHSCHYVLNNGLFKLESSSQKHIMGLSNYVEYLNNDIFIKVMDETKLVMQSSLDIKNINLVLYNSSLLLDRNITIGSNSTMYLSTKGSRIYSISDQDTTSLTESSSNIDNYLDDVSQFADDFDSMSIVNVKQVNINDGGKLWYMTHKAPIVSANYIIVDEIFIDSGGIIQASNVVINQETAWVSGNLTNIYSYYGKHSGTNFAATGGGNAGYGTQGYGNRNAGNPSGSLLKPMIAIGGPGGSDLGLGVSGGGAGGNLIINFTANANINGLIDVSGGSANAGCSGGGAGGSLWIHSMNGSLTGTGQVYSLGGNGSISAASLNHGGGGSGGLVVIDVCKDSFTGSFDLRGGLSLRLPLSLPQQVTTDLYAKLLKINQNQLTDVSRGLRGLQEVIAGSAGIAQKFYMFNSTSSGLKSANCFARSNYEYLQKFIIRSWNAQDLHGDNSTVSQNIIDSLKLNSTYEIESITEVADTTIDLNEILPYTELIVGSMELQSSHLTFSGNGTLSVESLSCLDNSVLTVKDTVEFNPKNDLTVNNFTLKIMDDAYIRGKKNLNVMDGGMVYFSRSNETEIFDESYSDHNRTFAIISLSNGGSIKGPKLIIFADSLTLQSNSTISADGLGYYGGYYSGPNSNVLPTKGSGPGGGYFGDTGADGGCHGGIGGMGINAYYSYVSRDQYQGLTQDVSSIDNGTSNYVNVSYGNMFAPKEYGSGGGASSQLHSVGGRGGGVIVLYIKYDIMIDGSSSISADGESVYEKGGGGGAGGSIWIREVGTGSHVYGSGMISAVGGKTCYDVACSVSILFPGGVGGGGRIRIETHTEAFEGTVSVLPGISNQSQELLLTEMMGTIVRRRAISTIVRNLTSIGEAIDVILVQPPVHMVQVITTSGYGVGNRNATTQSGAVVRGYWGIGYRSSRYNAWLSSQATASEVKSALTSFNLTDIQDITVTRDVSSGNGWTWSITFFNSIEQVVTIDVDGSRLYSITSNIGSINSAQISVSVLNPYLNNTHLRDVTESDDPARYDYSDLSNMFSFSYPILCNSSYGYWLNFRTIRIYPNISSTTTYFIDYLYKLQLKHLIPIDTSLGYVYSTAGPYLLDFYEPNWIFPTSVPSSGPSDQPSSQPSSQ
eukprot:gene6691-9175_t